MRAHKCAHCAIVKVDEDYTGHGECKLTGENVNLERAGHRCEAWVDCAEGKLDAAGFFKRVADGAHHADGN